MALYNTLFSFPFPVAHGTVNGGLTLPLETIHRWYWRVRRWQTVMMLGEFSSTSYFEPSRNGNFAAAEESLLLPGDLAASDGTISDPDRVSGYVNLWLFRAPNGATNTLYDPASATYGWIGATGYLQVQPLPDDQDQQIQQLYFDPYTEGGSPITVPVTIDGLSYSARGGYAGGGAQPNVSCTITPVEYWSWGGKYDTSTGAKL